MRVHFSALGCRLNEAEVERLSRTAVALGHEVVADVSQADWALINTCTVTHVAARKSRQAIRRLHQRAPEVRIAVLGCYGTMTPEVALSLPGVAMVIPNAEKERALRLIAEASDASGSATAAAVSAHPPVRRTRAFVKIQDGCDNHCTYCVVRIARGPARSRPYPEVLAEISQRITEGAREVVLTGVNIGSYGRDLVGHEAAGTVTLATMVARLLEETTIPRLRLSSLEPWDVDERLLALFADPRLCPQAVLSGKSSNREIWFFPSHSTLTMKK
ncbi:MAG: hypothetical protein GXX94_11485 [Chloroflexi bacterium]|nr:hypothetical protein [Chloroflexota bacterium]